MIAVFGDKVICIAMIVGGQLLHECMCFGRRQTNTTQCDGAPVDKAWTVLWLHLKHSCNWEIMGSKTIFQSMNCHNKVKIENQLTISQYSSKRSRALSEISVK